MNPRYKELKYEGKEYTKRHQIDEILIEKKFGWLLDAEVENLRIEILKDTLIINAGIWYAGVFVYGCLRSVDWRSGLFENGVIYNGNVFKNVTVEKGIIFGSVFLSGNAIFCNIYGGEFMPGFQISDQCDRSDLKTQTEENNGVDAQSIHENRLVRFKNFTK